jgi:hypothetical protein
MAWSSSTPRKPGRASGDLFPGDELPHLDAKNSGSALEICRTLDNGYRSIKDATLVVTGHGGEQTWPQLQEYPWFNNRFLNDVWTAREGSGRRATKLTRRSTRPPAPPPANSTP